MGRTVSESLLDQLFRKARTHKAWLPRPVAPTELRRLYELIRWGPTSNNSSPLRITFAVSQQARSRALSAIHTGNHPKLSSAPVIAVLSYDAEHWRHWQRLSPHKNLEDVFGRDIERSRDEAYRNALIQCGYLIIGARALGLDIFPLTGFDRSTLDATDLVPSHAASILVCGIGKGDPGRLRPRAERLAFEEACRIL